MSSKAKAIVIASMWLSLALMVGIISLKDIAFAYALGFYGGCVVALVTFAIAVISSESDSEKEKDTKQTSKQEGERR